MTQRVIWDESYSVGIPEIDDQHKLLFGLYNDLLVAYQAKDNSVVASAFEKLVNYLDEHFSDEEKFLRLDNEIYRKHRRLHFDFVKYVLRETNGGKELDSLESLLDFLSAWLIEHVQTIDKSHFQELRDKGLL